MMIHQYIAYLGCHTTMEPIVKSEGHMKVIHQPLGQIVTNAAQLVTTANICQGPKNKHTTGIMK